MPDVSTSCVFGLVMPACAGDAAADVMIGDANTPPPPDDDADDMADVIAADCMCCCCMCADMGALLYP